MTVEKCNQVTPKHYPSRVILYYLPIENIAMLGWRAQQPVEIIVSLKKHKQSKSIKIKSVGRALIFNH